MKRLVVVLFFSLFIVGCAAIKEQVDYAKLCFNDPVCLEEATEHTKMLQLQAESVGGIIPIPLSWKLISSVAGSLGLAWFLMSGGKKKKKKK